MKKLLLAYVAALIGAVASADVTWKTTGGNIGADGDLSSTGPDGWNQPIPTSATVWFYWGGTYTPYLDGTVLELNKGGVTYLRNMTSRGETHLMLDVRNGADLTMGVVQMGDYNDPTNDIYSMAVNVRGGSKLAFTGDSGIRSGNSTLTVTDGSTFTTTNFYIHDSQSGAIHARLAIVDSTWDARGNLTLGASSLANRSLANIQVGFTNATLRLPGSLYAYGADVAFSNAIVDAHLADGSAREANNANIFAGAHGTITFAGGTYSGLVLAPGCVAGPATIRLLDGSFDLAGWQIGPHNQGQGLLEVNGENVVVRHATTYWNNIGQTGTGTVSLVKGLVQGKDYGFIRIGNMDTRSVGTVNISGGRWENFNPTNEAEAGGFYVGETGEGHLNVSGGVVNMGYIRLVSTRNSSDMRQTGGLISLCRGSSDNGYMRICKDDDDTHVGKVYLNGGVLEARKIYGGALAELHADGGTVRPYASAADRTVANPFLYGLGTAALGEKGLTVDTYGYDARITQNFTNESETAGLFRKTGSGTLTLASSIFAVAKTSVEGGTLAFDTASPVFGTALTVTNGATFSLAGTPTGVTLTGLKVCNGTLALDPDDVITVNGPVEFKDLTLSFSTTPTAAKAFLVCDGELSEDNQRALLLAHHAAIPEGEYGKLTPVYDAGTGKTTVTFTLEDEKPALTAATVWTGSGAWTTDGNWSDGQPTAAKKATFGTGSASRAVTAAGTVPAGALEFTVDGYSLSGGAVEIASERGAARIDVTAGATTIGSTLVLDTLTHMTVGSGAQLTLNGSLSEGGFDKTGSGRLVLSGTGAECPLGLAFKGGTTEVKTEAAFGTRVDALNRVTMQGDTLEIRSADGAELVFDQDVALAAPTATNALILKSETPATFKSLKLEAGAIVKRGPAKLTLEVENGDYLTRGIGSITGTLGNYNIPNELRFNTDGTAPAQGYAGLTIAEGELCVKPSNPEETPLVNAASAIMVGPRLYEGVANPTLTIDHVYFNANMGNGIKTFIGYYLNDAAVVMLEPTLRVVNGATYYCDTMEMASSAYNPALSARPTMIVEDATVQATWQLGLGFNCSQGGNAAVVRGRHAKFVCPMLSVSGVTHADFSNSVLRAQADTGSVAINNVSYSPAGYLRFADGSELRSQSIALNPFDQDFSLVFDNSTWNFGTGDFSLADTNTAQFASPNHFSLVLQGIGMIVSPAAGKTLLLDVPVTGKGGLVNRGSGTVKLAAGRYAFTGKLVAEAGVVDLSDAGTIENATISGGAGVIQGGTFHNATIILDSLGGAVPDFEDCVFTGKTIVSVNGLTSGVTDAYVGQVSGTVQGVETFRLQRNASNLTGTFRVENGRILMSTNRGGFMIIIR